MKKEEKLQISVSKYIKMQYPNVIFTSESSGIRVSMGVAVQMKKQRSAHKLPDMIILEPSKGYNGLCLELKNTYSDCYLKNGDVRKTKHIQEQAKTLQLLEYKGYKATFGCGFDEVKRIIDEYLK